MAPAVSYQLALIVKNPNSEQFQFLVTRQKRPVPEKFDGLPHSDRELWDLPVAPLPKADGRKVVDMASFSEESNGSVNVIRCVTNSIFKLGLMGYDVSDAVIKVYFHQSKNWLCYVRGIHMHRLRDVWARNRRRRQRLLESWDEHLTKVQAQVNEAGVRMSSWRYWRLVEEPNFGPGPPLHTLMFMTDLDVDEAQVPGGGQWLDSQAVIDLLAQSGAHEKRIGPFAAVAVSPHVSDGLVNGITNVHGQEYPPGVVLVPMSSITGNPFSKTNLVIFSPSIVLTKENNTSPKHAASGDVLIADPGCIGMAQTHLKTIVKSLPKNMLVFLTHHHFDHIDGLPIVRKQNPDAVLVAHEATFRRMGKATKGFRCVSVVGGSKLLVGGHELEVVSAPGHTDGHLAFYDSATGTLVVGDHCVGQGSSVLDPSSGGNLQDYMDTTRRLLDLKPHMLVPMHGRPTLWPAHMLNAYIKHRESRELKILKAIEGGARSAFDIVSSAYADTSTTLWPWALANVKLHVEHLEVHQKLPEAFSTEGFEKSCKSPFAFRCGYAMSKTVLHRPWRRFALASRTTQLSSLALALVFGAVILQWIFGRK